MPSFKLDGKDIPFEPGDTIMRAAWRAGVEIPHYCWHPGLSVAANCRMCLVDIKGERPSPQMPIVEWNAKKKQYLPTTKTKLMPACQMPAVEGQEVFQQTDNVKEAQGAVQEFLLLNHPVDCPICDQAGECKLQDYYDEHQAKPKRKTTEPVHKVKGERFGETIVYDGERCVMCTRCIRVCDEVAGDSVLDMRERGNKNEIVLAPGRELDHNYTLMTEHVCPVGALTSRDFRFKARVWFLRTAEGVCNGCATGCSTEVDYDPRDNKVYRLRPRDNPEVNQFWMCDDGMMTYKGFHENRVTAGRITRDGQVVEADPDEAVEAAAEALGGLDGSKIAVVLSAQHSTEDNLVLAKLAREHFKTDKLFLAARGGWDGDDILRNADNNPNRAGAMAVAGGALGDLDTLVEQVNTGDVYAVLSLGSVGEQELDPLRNIPTVALTANRGAFSDVASVVVPVASDAETFGSFINAKGISQTFRRAVFPPHGVRAAWETLLELAKLLGADLKLEDYQAIQGALPAPEAPAPSVSASPEAQV